MLIFYSIDLIPTRFASLKYIQDPYIRENVSFYSNFFEKWLELKEKWNQDHMFLSIEWQVDMKFKWFSWVFRAMAEKPRISICGVGIVIVWNLQIDSINSKCLEKAKLLPKKEEEERQN